MEAFNQTIGLRMVGGGLDVGDGQQATEGGPELGSELRTSVAGDGGRNAKPLDPAQKEGGCTISGGHRGEGNCLSTTVNK